MDGHIGRLVALLSELDERQVGMVEDHIDELRAEGLLCIREGLHTARAGLTTCGQLCTHNHYRDGGLVVAVLKLLDRGVILDQAEGLPSIATVILRE